MVAVIPPGGEVWTSSWITDHLVAGPPAATDINGLSSPLDPMLTAELAGAQAQLATVPAEMLLAALGRAVARVLGDGRLDVDVEADIVLSRLAGRVALQCRDEPDRTGRPLLMTGRDALRAASPAAEPAGPSDVRFAYRTHYPAPAPDSRHLLALHVWHTADMVHLDWWYDARSFERSTVEELAGQLSLALVAICAGP